MSFTTPLDIANRALQHCGVTRIRTNTWPPTENSKQAAEVAFVYDKLRQAELRRNCWRFAIRRTVLRPITATTMLFTPSVWSSTVKYGPGAVVNDGTGTLWFSTVGSNLGVQPGLNTNYQWSLYFGSLLADIYNPATTYYAGELVYTTDNDGHFQVYVSGVSNNTDAPGTADDYDPSVTYGYGAVVNYPPLNPSPTNAWQSAALLAQIQALLPTLPTTLPSSPGVLWNDGGVICIS